MEEGLRVGTVALCCGRLSCWRENGQPGLGRRLASFLTHLVRFPAFMLISRAGAPRHTDGAGKGAHLLFAR